MKQNRKMNTFVLLLANGEGYLELFPQVDWSRSWTDKEILKELGLPEDFLEKD